MKRRRLFFIAIISLMAFDAVAWYGVSPYAYCAGDPVNFVDPDGQNPIYDTDGNFLGTDDMGLQGCYYVMDKNNFSCICESRIDPYANLKMIPLISRLRL